MESRQRAALGVSIAALMLLLVAGFALMAVSWPLPVTYAEWGFPGFEGTAAIVIAAVSVPVVARRPRNPVGWLLLAAAVMSAVQFAGHQYAIYGLHTAPGTVPEPWIGTWIEEWIWLAILACMGILTFLLFPTGSPPSPRWQPIVGLTFVGVVSGSIGSMLLPVGRVPGAVSPIAMALPELLVYLLVGGGTLLLMVLLFVALASLIVRFRRAGGVERQQLKWLAMGGLTMAAGLVVYSVRAAVAQDLYGSGEEIFALSLFAIPISISVAMLRHGLYEVDRLINRTVVYGVVSIVLLTLYAATVLVLQPVLHPITGGDTLAVAASTLLVATVFQPVRRRVQLAVDRRFFRSRYDAQQSAERLSQRIREEVDAHRLTSALLAEVGATMQPSSVTIWTRRR